jgi:hypothetical protein
MSGWKQSEDLQLGQWFKLDPHSSTWLMAGRHELVDGSLRVEITRSSIQSDDPMASPESWRSAGVTAVEFSVLDGALVWYE